MARNAEAYEREVLAGFASDGDPDLLIVVDRLLTGFDEPRNAVLYIDKPLKGHNLIQAVARVNRLQATPSATACWSTTGDSEGARHGDSRLPGPGAAHAGQLRGGRLEGLYHSFSTEYKRLPGLHDRLWSFFSEVVNRKDIEQYRRVLAPKLETAPDGETFDARQKLRDDFYEALTAFGLCLQTALGSRSFFEDGSFSERLIESYKQDLRWFTSLRKIARQDAMETVDYSVYEEQIRRLVDKQVIGREVHVEPRASTSSTNWAKTKNPRHGPKTRHGTRPT